MTVTVTDEDRGMAALAQRLAGKIGVRVGILADAPKQHDPRKVVDGKRKGKKNLTEVTFDGGTHVATLLEVAFWNEFGTADIPQRSFIRATVDENLDRIQALQAALAKRIILAEITAEQAMAQLGAFVKGLIQSRIARGIEPANAPSTVARKGSSKPLIDTGQLRSSIDFVVERDGKP